VRLRPHTRLKYVLWFRPQCHTSDKLCYYLDPLHVNVFSRCYVHLRRPITSLDCVLLKDNNRAPLARLGPQINYRDCLCVPQGQRHNARCCHSIQRFIFLLMFCLETLKEGSGPINRLPEPLLTILSAISFPLTPAWPGTQYSLTACRVEIFNPCWHCRTK